MRYGASTDHNPALGIVLVAGPFLPDTVRVLSASCGEGRAYLKAAGSRMREPGI